MENEWETCQEVLRVYMQILSVYLLFLFSFFPTKPKENWIMESLCYNRQETWSKSTSKILSRATFQILYSPSQYSTSAYITKTRDNYHFFDLYLNEERGCVKVTSFWGFYIFWRVLIKLLTFSVGTNNYRNNSEFKIYDVIFIQSYNEEWTRKTSRSLLPFPHTFKPSNCLYSLHHNNYAVKIVLVMSLKSQRRQTRKWF